MVSHMSDQLKAGNKLFEFDIEVRDGEHEYTYAHLVQDKDEESANKKARKYCKSFLGSKMVWTDERTLEPEGMDGEYRHIRYDGVCEITYRPHNKKYYCATDGCVFDTNSKKEAANHAKENGHQVRLSTFKMFDA